MKPFLSVRRWRRGIFRAVARHDVFRSRPRQDPGRRLARLAWAHRSRLHERDGPSASPGTARPARTSSGSRFCTVAPKLNPEFASPGWSSPIVWRERIFLTTSTWPQGLSEKERRGSIAEQHVLCFQVSDGKQLWDTVVPSGKSWSRTSTTATACRLPPPMASWFLRCSAPGTGGARFRRPHRLARRAAPLAPMAMPVFAAARSCTRIP